MPSPNLQAKVLGATVMKLIVKPLVEKRPHDSDSCSYKKDSFTMCGLKKKMGIYESRSTPSLDSRSIGTITRGYPASLQILFSCLSHSASGV